MKEEGRITDEDMKKAREGKKIRRNRPKKIDLIRRKAREELESRSKETTSCAEFFKLARKEIEKGKDLQESDVHMLGSAIASNVGLLTTKNLKVVVMQYIKLDKAGNVNKFLDNLIKCYGETEFGDALRKYKQIAEEKLSDRVKKVDHPAPGEE